MSGTIDDEICSDYGYDTITERDGCVAFFQWINEGNGENSVSIGWNTDTVFNGNYNGHDSLGYGCQGGLSSDGKTMVFFNLAATPEKAVADDTRWYAICSTGAVCSPPEAPPVAPASPSQHRAVARRL